VRGRVAVITGGGRGIGEAVALAFSREGATIVLAARSASELAQVEAKVRAAGGAAVAIPTDVSSPTEVSRLVRRALDAFGRVDVLVNAAGIVGPVGPLWDADPEAWKQTVEVNLYGTFLCCRAVVPHMMERRGGHIVNFSGGGAASPLPRMAAYGASKAAVVRLTETLAEELRPFNIAVNAIAAGMVDTRLLDPVLAAGERGGEQFDRVRRLRGTGEGGVPAELPAALALWLASDGAHGLSGKLISAPYDGWRGWDERRIAALKVSPWFTLRRLDHATLRPLIGEIITDDAG
jgi:NAD(P)-dependent dehydrogenase (short-subunit alcohol dehydrogenase family)